MKKLIALTFCALGCISLGKAQVIYSTAGSTYTQNFDTLTATAGTGQTWSNNNITPTLPGWFLFTKDSTDITSYGGDTGSTNTGNFYSFGSASATDRALGGIASGNTYFGTPAPGAGAVAGWIAFGATNSTGSNLSGFSVAFVGEQWRNGGAGAAQSMVLEYGIGNSFSTVSSWTAPGAAFNWGSPVATGGAAAVDGNVAGKVSGVGGSVSSITWNSGDTLWVRWIENNDAGSDHGLAIDDFSFASVPEPSALPLMACGFALLALRRRRVA